MKPRLLIWPLFALLLSILQNGCSKEKYLPGLRGHMVGFVYTADEFGYVLDDRSNVKVTAIGLDQSYSALSNSAGRFILEDIPTGTYELHFTKKGFGVLKQFGIQHLGGEATILLNSQSEEQAYILYEMPATVIEHLGIVNDSLTCEFTFPKYHPISNFNLRAYFSSSGNFTWQDADYIENVTIWQTDGKYWGRFHFESTPFSPDETIYFKACRYTSSLIFSPPYQDRKVYGVRTYFNYELNETIYPNLGDESEEYSFIFPE